MSLRVELQQMINQWFLFYPCIRNDKPMISFLSMYPKSRLRTSNTRRSRNEVFTSIISHVSHVGVKVGLIWISGQMNLNRLYYSSQPVSNHKHFWKNRDIRFFDIHWDIVWTLFGHTYQSDSVTPLKGNSLAQINPCFY